MSIFGVSDEFGKRVYDFGGRCPIFNLRSDYVELVKSISDKYRLVCELNERYADDISVCKDSYCSLGKVFVNHEDVVSEKNRLRILQDLACYDVYRVERVASWLKTGVPFVKKYMDLFDDIMCNFHTDESLIPSGYSFAMYYDVEYDYINNILNPFCSLPSNFDVCYLTIHWYLHTDLGGHLSVSNIYDYFQLSYSIQELDSVIIFAKSHRKDFGVFNWMSNRVLSDAGSICSVCGRPVSECGPLSVYSLAGYHFVFEDNDLMLYDMVDPDFSYSTVCALCSDCIDIMLREMDDYVAYTKRFPYVLHRGFHNPDELSAFRKSVSDFCLEKMRQGLPVRYVPGIVCDNYTVRKFTKDERKVRRTCRYLDGFLNICKTLLFDLWSLFFREKCSLDSVTKQNFEVLNGVISQFVYDVKFSCDISEVFGDDVMVHSVDNFKILCKQRVDNVLRFADKIASNRRLSDVYFEGFCKLLSDYRFLRRDVDEKKMYARYKSDYQDVCHMYLHIPTRCFVTFRVSDGRFGRRYGCSVEYLCELAGLQHSLGSYVPDGLTVENRLF